MKNYGLYLWLFPALLLVVAAVSCERVDTETDEFGISLRHGEVDASEGSQFVTVQASGQWEITLSYQDGEDVWARVDITSGSGSRSDILLRYSGNGSESDRSVSLVLASDGREASCTLLQRAASGGDDGPGDEEGLLPGHIPGWMELPAMSEDDGLRFVTHSMTIDGKSTRNYSLYWDSGNLVAHWVAYPLSRWTIGTEDVGRTDEWQYDPEIGQEYQPCLFRGFPSGGSPGYDRGHQIPSADRQNTASNRQTFYFTNMTPQLSSFNQGIWATLENKVRSIATGSDTLYVVTGCIVDGRAGVAYDNEHKAVTVPSAYFKALLRYQKASTTGVGGYSAAGYLLEHKSGLPSSPDASMLMSIDRLEELTGIDFFVNLAAVLGEDNAARVEAESPSEKSWL